MTDYNSIDAVRWSTLKAMRVSPKHYRHALGQKHEPSASMRIGTAIHTRVLEPDEFSKRHPVYAFRRAGKDWDAFKARHEGAEILSASEYEQAVWAGHAVLEHPIAQRHMVGSYHEKIITWDDAATGIKCKARADLVNGHLVELKSTGDAVPRRFGSTAARLGYHGQVAWYLDGLHASGYETHGDPAIITVEQEPPHDVVVYTVPHHVVEQGRMLYRRLLDRLAECIAADEWPGIADTEVELSLPGWVESEESNIEPPFTMNGVRLEVADG